MPRYKDQKPAEEQPPWSAIMERLEVLIRLTALNVGSDLTLAARAPMLHRAGLDRKAIADVCGTTPEVVSVRLAEAKNKTRKRKR